MDHGTYLDNMARAKAAADAGNPENIFRHVAETHSTPMDVGRMASEAKVRTVVLNHQLRGTGKQLWLMTDPWGDSPALNYEYYKKSYADNLVAALLFPAHDRFQPQIWPNRL